ncbi:MAG TPA: ATP synthase F1 subunit gamma [Spirochaetota bacterium]|nr:ATP synthase F1 subunit gamma [Spirochaetota bacterium]
MASARDIKRRIKSVSNTKKITNTMEMVATSKMKKLQERLNQSKPYEIKVNEIIKNLMTAGFATINHPLFREVAQPSRCLILQIAGNRGLCGSYNVRVIEKTLAFKEQLESEGKEVLLYVIGKKATSFYNFTKQPMYKSGLNLEDKFNFDEAAKLGEELTKLFLSGEFHEIYISYTKVFSSAVQKPEIIKLFPITPEVEIDQDFLPPANMDYIFEPNPAEIFSYILPLYLKVKIFTCFLESSYSEQFSRRVAMKNATDAAKEMIRELTISYNRARQDKITTEISEIVGGAAALE